MIDVKTTANWTFLNQKEVSLFGPGPWDLEGYIHDRTHVIMAIVPFDLNTPNLKIMAWLLSWALTSFARISGKV